MKPEIACIAYGHRIQSGPPLAHFLTQWGAPPKARKCLHRIRSPDPEWLNRWAGRRARGGGEGSPEAKDLCHNRAPRPRTARSDCKGSGTGAEHAMPEEAVKFYIAQEAKGWYGLV